MRKVLFGQTVVLFHFGYTFKIGHNTNFVNELAFLVGLMAKNSFLNNNR